MDPFTPTVPCSECGEAVIKADINLPGITGTEYLNPRPTSLQVIVGYRWEGVAQTEHVWGHNRHYCPNRI